MDGSDPLGARAALDSGEAFHRIEAVADPSRLPYTICVLLENLIRRAGSEHVSEADVRALAAWPEPAPDAQLAFMPARVIMQDLTGVPAVVDLAAMRSAVARRGGDPGRVDPLVPVDLVIDHSVQVDAFGSGMAYERNIEREYERNGERYALLRWAQGAFRNFRVVPPGMGIVHQVNLEYLGRVVEVRDGVAIPDTLVGTDSHTTMINALGVLGWGVGGIEAEAVMLGQPMYLTQPVVVGVRLEGALRTGVTATDLVLTMTERLRKHGVVGKFIELYGPGLGALTIADRATISNMSPEFGATASTFPVDGQTLRYLADTGRSPERVALVERYTKEQGLFRSGDEPEPVYSEKLDFDLSEVEPSLAGPRRPQDRVSLPRVGESFSDAFGAPQRNGGHLGHGSVVISAITSCTNTSNPALMVAAGLVARKAVERGLETKPWVKTSLAPGSRVVIGYLRRAGLMEPLQSLRFDLVGFGCTTCIGNSGPLPDDVAEAIERDDLKVAAVLSGNRNFEARIHPAVRANYLASPPLVVAYALAGSVNTDLTTEPLGQGSDGPVYLRDVWPTADEVEEALAASFSPDLFTDEYGRIFDGDERWRELPVPAGELFAWAPDSTYVREASFFEREPDLSDIENARVLVWVGDSVTTDHISPAGAFAPSTPAGEWLLEHGVETRDFNSYGARRGNHEVMVRGTFANIRLRNRLVDPKEGGFTRHLPSGEEMTIYAAAQRYAAEGVPLVVLAGREYGSGSSRDWAAKGTALLGVRAVIAQSYERIHRSNLVALGVLPLQFAAGESAESLGLTGTEAFTIRGLDRLDVGSQVEVEVDGGRRFTCLARLDAPADVKVYRAGGLLQMVMRQLADQA
ncbi:MAG TPA: aconitate hydratase AcnA [Gaiellales bacterium]|nr:aconitate hydratase AcnA [Gaiellales bacterium]